MRGRDLLSISELNPDELDLLLRSALAMKRDGTPPLLSGKTVAMLFEKPSLRTRVSFEVGMQQLGGNAIYLSRAPIPYFRDSGGANDSSSADSHLVLVHLGLYAYTASFLETFSSLQPGKLEMAEKLEMLRATEHGYSIAVGVSDDPYIEIDTLEQARDFEKYLEKNT